MIIQRASVELAERRAGKLPASVRTGTHKLDFVPDRQAPANPQAIAQRAQFLSNGGARPSEAEFERLMGTNDLVDEFFLKRALLAAQPVARISIRADGGHERGCASGFMVSPRLLLTNHHVFTSPDEAAPSVVEFNYTLDIAGNPAPSYRFRVRPDSYYFSNEALDFCLVSIEPQTDAGVPLSTFGYHRLIPRTGKALLKEWMNIIQHPGGGYRQYAIRENQCVEDSDPDVIWYVSDTAQGTSGSPVLNDSFQVVALHQSGVARRNEAGLYLLKTGKTVQDLRDADDSDVDWIANAGIRVSRICQMINQAPEKNGHLAELRAAMETGDVLSNAFATPQNENLESKPMNITTNSQATNGRLVLGTLVLELNIAGASILPRQAEPRPALSVPPESSNGEVEALKEPFIAPNLENRKGFDRNFLGIETPFPNFTNPAVVAPLKAGSNELKYEHFSVFMHRDRRLAILAASNVDSSQKSKKPEPGHDYSRKGLTGLVDFDFEKWVNDSRMDDKFQLPDVFYSKDNGAFDKGHVARREDVAFGTTFEQVRRGNGDSFHVTNCSPQRGDFNQSQKNGIWGQLENFIGAQAKTELFSLFAGPLLSDADKEFKGKDDSGPVRVKIPDRFWKVVCAKKDDKLQVFAFLVEQDLSGVPLEFQVTAEWKAKMLSLKDLETKIGLLKFQQVYHDADQGKNL